MRTRGGAWDRGYSVGDILVLGPSCRVTRPKDCTLGLRIWWVVRNGLTHADNTGGMLSVRTKRDAAISSNL